MLDLYIGFAIVIVASAGLWLLGAAAARRIRYPILITSLVILLGGLLWFVRSNPDRLILSHVLPFSNLIILGNLTLPAVALFCGAGFGKMPGSPIRRCILVVPLLALAAYDVAKPMLGGHPHLSNQWGQGVCRQSSNFSCGPAAAATLLKSCGISSTEPEMADLCLTNAQGTATAGIYRGLKLKTAGQHLAVRPFHSTIEELRQSPALPALLTVGLQRGVEVDPRYENRWGWAPGVRHTIVLFRFLPNNRVEVGDPTTGREVWGMQSLRDLWQGDGIRIVGEE